MVFSSFLFIFYFLPIILLTYFLAPRFLKNTVLVGASLLFFAWGEPRFTLTLLTLCLVDFLLAQAIDRTKDRLRKLVFFSSIAVNITALCYFKYSNFFIGEISRAAINLGFGSIPWTKVALPIGISFLTFHKISYVTDVYRRIRPASKNPVQFLLYILFFPQLISGPIVRYHEIENQLHYRPFSIDNVFEGFVRFFIGLGKKVLIADVVGHTADQIFGLESSQLSQSYAWLGMVAYTAQIYFDFSGYSDMAIGLARIFGFHFPENFDNPYIASSVTDFWRRWHISFGRWMREYLYYPLGGSRVGPVRQYVNLWVVFLFSGLWHGAQWTFVLWGIWHGLFMTAERLFLGRVLEKFPLLFRIGWTLLLVALSKVLFRADSIAHALSFYRSLIGINRPEKQPVLGQVSSSHELSILVIAYMICFFPLILSWIKKTEFKFEESAVDGVTIARGVGALMIFALAVTSMAGTDFSPFIYFQF